MINKKDLLNRQELLNGLHGPQLKRINQINRWYEIYEGDQEWEKPSGLDYTPTQKVSNFIKTIIDTKARFMFGKEPFFDLKQVEKDDPDQAEKPNRDAAQEKEDLLHQILKENKFHKKLLKAKKDAQIGGKVAIKLWARKDKGVKIVFIPAQEFFTRYSVDDVEELEAITFLYSLNDEEKAEDQRVMKQEWEMKDGSCYLTEALYNGKGEVIKSYYDDTRTKMDFIPAIVIQNGGLTGETEGTSDVAQVWDNQDKYNKITSDDLDALKFQMFGQDVLTDASEESIKKIQIAPGALVDLQTDPVAANAGRQAQINRQESSFSYNDKFTETVNRLKNDMFDIMGVPNISLDQIRGMITSGKSMRALYWGLIAVCEEDATEWEPALEEMVNFIFKLVEIYNLYDNPEIAEVKTTLDIIREYPIPEDTDEQKQADIKEVIAEVRSRHSYINKWQADEDTDGELNQIIEEKRIFEEDYSADLVSQAEGDIPTDEEIANMTDEELEAFLNETGDEDIIGGAETEEE